MSKTLVEVDGRQLALSNLDKVLYPACGLTKAQVLAYYRQIAPVLLPHLKDRALTLKRYPDGVEGEFFFEKRCPVHRPPWTQTAPLAHRDDAPIQYCLVNDLATLMWVANLATLELHVPLARAESPHTPDAVVFDLDPGEGAGLLECARVALILHDLFTRLGLESVVKTSGQKGLHVYVPLNSPSVTFDDAKTFCRAVALLLQKTYPELVTSKMAKDQRTGRVFLNWEQNSASKTMICVYSLRAREKPYVSFPFSWPELSQAVGEGNPEKLRVTHDEALKRVGETGDLFSALLTQQQSLPHLGG